MAALSKKRALLFLLGLVLAVHFITKAFSYPTDVVVAYVSWNTSKETGVSTLKFGLENRTARLQRPVILIRLRDERKKKLARDPAPLYKNEMLISLFANENREIRHDITLAIGRQVVTMEVRVKSWFD